MYTFKIALNEYFYYIISFNIIISRRINVIPKVFTVSRKNWQHSSGGVQLEELFKDWFDLINTYDSTKILRCSLVAPLTLAPNTDPMDQFPTRLQRNNPFST